MNKQWEKNIHDRLKDFPMKAPEGLLDEIKSEMTRRGAALPPVQKTSAQRYPVFIRRAAAVAAVFLLLFSLSFLWTEQTDLPVAPAIVSEQDIVSEQKQAVEEPSTGGYSEPVRTVALSAAGDTKRIARVDSLPSKQEQPMVEESKEEAPKGRQAKEEEAEKASPQTVQGRSDYPTDRFRAKRIKASQTSWSTGFYYAGVVAQNNLDHRADRMQTSPMYSSNDLNSLPADEYALYQTVLEEKEVHHLPVHIGLSVGYHLNDRWSIHSGLIYSYLSSDLSKSNQHISYHTQQKLHYVGIPLQVGYQLWSNKRLKGYVAAGGQVDKLIYGEAVSDYSVNDEQQSTSHKTVSDRKLLFSAQASIGAELLLSRDFSLYIEPGLHYYFKNGSKLQTYYNEQPLNFNLTVGLRFQWNK